MNVAGPVPSQAGPASWHYRQSSPLGDVVSCVELRADGLHCRCEGLPAQRHHMLHWDEIVEAATAVLEPPPRRHRGGPAMPDGGPEHLEWLLLARAQGPAVMQPLPDGVAAAAVGRVELEGRGDGGWQPALYAHGGEIGLMTLEDDTGAGRC